jgi:hypothetical protein
LQYTEPDPLCPLYVDSGQSVRGGEHTMSDELLQAGPAHAREYGKGNLPLFPGIFLRRD